MKRCPREGARRGGGTDRRADGDAHDCVELWTDGGQGPTDGRRGSQNDQPQQNNQRQQPPEHHQSQHGSQGSQPRGPSQQENGVSRRQLLFGGGGALAVLGGGWFFFLRDGGDPTDSPEAVTEAYFEALIDGDRQRADALTHADSPMEEFTDTDLARDLEGQDTSIETAVTDKESSSDPANFDSVQDFAIVEVTYSSGGEEENFEVTVAQNTDGDWKMWLLAAY